MDSAFESALYGDIMSAIDAAEDPHYDLGPSKYVALMTSIIRECLQRIEVRTGASS